jgi:hypothetical protein
VSGSERDTLVGGAGGSATGDALVGWVGGGAGGVAFCTTAGLALEGVALGCALTIRPPKYIAAISRPTTSVAGIQTKGIRFFSSSSLSSGGKLGLSEAEEGLMVIMGGVGPGSLTVCIGEMKEISRAARSMFSGLKTLGSLAELSF